MRTRSLMFIKDRFNHIAYHIYIEFSSLFFCCRSLVDRILKIEFYILCLQSCVFIVQPSSSSSASFSSFILQYYVLRVPSFWPYLHSSIHCVHAYLHHSECILKSSIHDRERMFLFLTIVKDILYMNHSLLVIYYPPYIQL